MTILTPNFADAMKANGRLHVVAAHEPTREGEMPQPQYGAAPQNGVLVAAGPLKVALIGTAPSSRMLAPYNDPSWKIWGCSPGNMNTLPRVDLWFELHSNLLWPEHASYGPPYVEWLKQQKFPIYMQDQKLVPNAMVFPMAEMVAEFGRYFFTSSFAWMMALAIKMGASEIALYGIDMASRDEYILQRPGFGYFKQRAEERGIKVSAPHESDIMQPAPLYAYVDSTPMGRKLAAREKEIDGRIGPMIQQRDGLNQNITYLQGAKEDIDYQRNIWGGAMDEIVLKDAEIAQLRAENINLKRMILIPADAPQAQFAEPPIPRRRGRRPKQKPVVVQETAAEPVTEPLNG